MTFDDGPSIWTHELLDYLAIKKIKVTFFVNGLNYNLITDPEFAAVVKRAHDEGHQIASHTWAHADLSAVGVDIDSQMKQCKSVLAKEGEREREREGLKRRVMRGSKELKEKGKDFILSPAGSHSHVFFYSGLIPRLRCIFPMKIF